MLLWKSNYREILPKRFFICLLHPKIQINFEYLLGARLKTYLYKPRVSIDILRVKIAVNNPNSRYVPASSRVKFN